MREALRRLAALGLVSFIPNRGVRVRSLSRGELREAFLGLLSTLVSRGGHAAIALRDRVLATLST